MYVPAVLVPGVIAPVDELIVKPAVDEKTPPVVPVNVTACAVPSDEQKGEPLYDMVAIGNVVIVTDVVAVCRAHPPAAAIV